MTTKLLATISFWTKPQTPDFIRGSFNLDLLNKVLTAKLYYNENRIK